MEKLVVVWIGSAIVVLLRFGPHGS